MKSIAQNTTYNLIGYGVPILLAIFLLPEIISGLGKERFGLLSLVWIAIGYLSFFDFGLGRSLTKIIAEKLANNEDDQIPVIFWSALILMFAISFLFLLIFLFFFTSTAIDLLRVSENLKNESKLILIVVVLTLPVITTTTALRGFLEAYQRFDFVNVIRIILGVFTFLSPLLVLSIKNSLFWVVLILVAIRIIIWLIYILICLRLNRTLLNQITFSIIKIKPLLKFSMWISIANIIGPFLLYSDRFILGIQVSTVAITYYSTPYEMISKLLIIPSSLIAVLLPVFSAKFSRNSDTTKEIFITASKLIFIVIFPIVFIVILFSNELIYLWLGNDFALNSTFILQLLAVGILMNCLSLIPNIFFQGAGLPKIPTLINVFELPFYLTFMWLAISFWGTIGAALVYMTMAAVDAFLMYFFAHRIFKIVFPKVFIIYFTVVMPFLLLAFQAGSTFFKISFGGGFLVLFFVFSWKRYLTESEQIVFLNKFRINKLIRHKK
jgi:O-antigen/teichoic acid export membrane protein